MIWSETSIARALALQIFNRKYLMVVPNCTWPGSECDLLCITQNLRVIDIEIKISRADLKADAKKEKWWHYLTHQEAVTKGRNVTPWNPWNAKERTDWPRKVWKHYYALPKEIWKPELIECLPSPASGVLLLSTQGYDGLLIATVERQAKPCCDAAPISAASAIDIARLASLRMWDSFAAVENERAINARLRGEVAA